MTIDEAIKHCEEVAEENEKTAIYKPIDFCVTGEVEKCAKCAAEHKQLAEWLKELKAHREAWMKVSKRINLWKQDSERSDSIYAIGRMESFQKSLEIIAEYRPNEGDVE